jgi:hypothetical protein
MELTVQGSINLKEISIILKEHIETKTGKKITQLRPKIETSEGEFGGRNYSLSGFVFEVVDKEKF